MKFRGALALGLFVVAGCALGGTPSASGDWLLIVPPLNLDGSPDTSQALLKWQILGGFTRQVDCNTSLARQQFAARKQFGPITHAQSYDESIAVRLLNGQCVSKDKIQG